MAKEVNAHHSLSLETQLAEIEPTEVGVGTGTDVSVPAEVTEVAALELGKEAAEIKTIGVGTRSSGRTGGGRRGRGRKRKRDRAGGDRERASGRRRRRDRDGLAAADRRGHKRVRVEKAELGQEVVEAQVGTETQSLENLTLLNVAAGCKARADISTRAAAEAAQATRTEEAAKAAGGGAGGSAGGRVGSRAIRGRARGRRSASAQTTKTKRVDEVGALAE
ncbi:hypothetical protein PENSPDRAFT_159569, partial [Peniophora sp. CONT]